MSPPSRAPTALTIRDLPPSERPRERLARLGAESLSEQELLACVLGRGIAGESVLVGARRLLAVFGSLRGMAEASVEQLAEVRGIGQAKASQLQAAIEMARRLALPTNGQRSSLASFERAVAVLRPHLIDKQREHFVALLLDNRHRLIRMSPVAIGSLSATVVHPREVFREAITAHAAAIILAHNHPSGDPEPSTEDCEMTVRLVEAGALVGIEVLDHLIIGREGAVSLRERGLIETEPRAPRQRRRRRA